MDLTLEQIITTFLLVGGFLTAALLAYQIARNPLNCIVLTERITERSWNTLQLLFLLTSWFFLYFIASFSGLFFYEEQIPLVQLIIAVLVYTLLVIITGLINKSRGADLNEAQGLGLKNLKYLLWAPVFYLAAIPFIILLSKSYHLVLELLSSSEVELQEVAQIVTRERSWLEWCYIGVAVLIAPIYEEIVFRGVIFPFVVKRSGLIAGIVITSAAFALIHFHLPSLVALSLLSVWLCLSYWRTGSLWICMGIHMIFNAVTILALNIS